MLLDEDKIRESYLGCAYLMSQNNEAGVGLCPIPTNLVSVKTVKGGCHVTIACPLSVALQLASNEIIGGLLTLDKKQLEKYKI